MIDVTKMDEVQELLKNLNALLGYIRQTKSQHLFSGHEFSAPERIQPAIEIRGHRFITNVCGHYDSHESLQAAVNYFETFFVNMMAKLEDSYEDLKPMKKYNYYLSTGEIPVP